MSESGSNARFYDIKVVATDPSGNVGESICTVVVVPEYDPPPYKSKKSKARVPRPSRDNLIGQLSVSEQRFEIEEFKFVWSTSQDDSAVPPAVTQPPKSSKKSLQKPLRNDVEV